MFIRTHPRIRPLTRLGRLSVALCVSVVALLAWCAVDPQAHEFFHQDAHASAHGHDHAHHHDTEAADEHHCVITDFERGATDELLAGLVLLIGALFTFSRLTPAPAGAPAWTPRGWLPRAHAPPIAG